MRHFRGIFVIVTLMMLEGVQMRLEGQIEEVMVFIRNHPLDRPSMCLWLALSHAGQELEEAQIGATEQSKDESWLLKLSGG